MPPPVATAPSSPISEQPHLERVIGVSGVAFAGFNSIVGVGIFGLPGLVAALLGPAAMIAYLVCLLLIGLVGLCFAEAGSRVVASGGVYAYAHAAFGPVVGGTAGALIVVANSVAGAAAVVRLFLDTLAAIVPALASPIAGFAIASVFYVALVVVNIRGARDGAWLTVGISLIKLAPLALLVGGGLLALHPGNLVLDTLPSAGRIKEATLLLIFAFIGIESGSYVSGETRDPARTVPRAILLTLLMVAALYIGLQTAAQGVLGQRLAGAQTPLVDLARAVFGPRIAGLMAIAMLLSAIGYIIADMLVSPRVIFALAEQRQLPRAMATLHPRHHTPAMALVVYPILVLLFAATGTFRQIIVLATAGTLLLYLIVCLGVLRLRARGVAQAGVPFVAPGGVVTPLVAAAIIVWLLSSLSVREMAETAGFVVIAAASYALRQRFAPITVPQP